MNPFDVSRRAVYRCNADVEGLGMARGVAQEGVVYVKEEYGFVGPHCVIQGNRKTATGQTNGIILSVISPGLRTPVSSAVQCGGFFGEGPASL